MHHLEQLLKLKSEFIQDTWWTDSEQKVFATYHAIFHPDNVAFLTKEQFKSFLLIKNNLHWEGIHRQGNILTADMQKLRQYLGCLLDESTPIHTRLTALFDKNNRLYIKGMGRAVLTPILLMAYPQKYGVWNARSESALRALNTHPDFKNSESFANKYIEFNNTLTDLKNELGVSFWQLDGLLGHLGGRGLVEVEGNINENLQTETETEDTPTNAPEAVFAMERYLEEFIITNWNNTVFGKNYELLYDEGDLQSQQYRTGVGPIDILAISKDESEYLVIEVKKGKTSDAVVGQILRYTSWVQENLAHKKKVTGVIVCLEKDDNLHYATLNLPDIKVMTYKISFSLD